MKIFKSFITLLILTVLGRPLITVSTAQPVATNQIVVMISIDGLAAFYFDDPLAEMPTLHRLASEGAQAKQMRASTPTVTWPNHTTLVTGVTPARHGVVGNNFFDRQHGTNFMLITDPVLDKDQIVKVPTLYDLAKTQGLATLGIRWPVTRNAHSLDWVLPDMKSTEIIRKFTTPALLTECTQAGLPMLSGFETQGCGDAYCTKVFNHFLQTHPPTLALLHLINVDHIQHEKGPRTPEAYAAIKTADEQVGEVWAELQRDFPGRATLFVVSDHGFSPVKRTILPNVILRKAGLLSDQATPSNNLVGVVPQGGSVMIYVRNEAQAQRDDILARARKAFTGIPGVAKIVGTDEFKAYGVADPQVDPHAPDLIVFADEGCAFGKTTAGDALFVDKTEVAGTHGHDPNLPHMHASFIAWGAGIKPGSQLGTMNNTDVAPTIARLLQLNLPQPDGRVLEEILK